MSELQKSLCEQLTQNLQGEAGTYVFAHLAICDDQGTIYAGDYGTVSWNGRAYQAIDEVKEFLTPRMTGMMRKSSAEIQDTDQTGRFRALTLSFENWVVVIRLLPKVHTGIDRYLIAINKSAENFNWRAGRDLTNLIFDQIKAMPAASSANPGGISPPKK